MLSDNGGRGGGEDVGDGVGQLVEGRDQLSLFCSGRVLLLGFLDLDDASSLAWVGGLGGSLRGGLLGERGDVGFGDEGKRAGDGEDDEDDEDDEDPKEELDEE